MPPPDVTILYGSQTGCAEALAERLRRQGRARGFRPALLCMDEYDLGRLRRSAGAPVVFVTSTTGQGVAPDNMRSFWRALLVRDLDADLLAGVRFAVFGLGDSSYPIYNAVARRLYQRLWDLGARPFIERGLGDDQDEFGVESAFQPWAEVLWSMVAEFVVPSRPRPADMDGRYDASGVLCPDTIPVRVVEGAVPTAPPSLGGFGRGPGRYAPVHLICSDNQRLTTQNHWQDVRLVEFDLGDDPVLKYAPGDVVSVHPSNPIVDVERFLRTRLSLDPDTVVVLDRAAVDDDDEEEAARDERYPYGVPVTIGDLFTRWLDVFGTPRRYFFEALAPYATDAQERERLLELGAVDGQDDLLQYCDREKRTYAEVLDEFDSVQVPLGVLLDVIPRLRPRHFSIASAPTAHGRRLQIAVAVVAFRTPYGRARVGLCSRFLRDLRPGTAVPCWTRAGGLTMPSPTEATIMIGPGTGIAPFRSMCHELRSSSSSSERWVFFGCRNRGSDFLFADEWEALSADGTVTHVVTAFSRDPPSRVYVQDRLGEHGRALFRLLRAGARLYLAGSSGAMPRQVHDTLIEICAQHGAMSADAAERFLRGLQRAGRYVLETW